MLIWIVLVTFLSKVLSKSIHYADFNGAVKTLDETCGRPVIVPTIDNQNRIIGGTEAREHSWAWQVSIQRVGSNGLYHHICGGTVIAPNKILTAAHCFILGMEKDRYKVVVGKHDMSRIETLEKHGDVKKISFLKGFDRKKNKFPDDIIVIHLTEYLEFNDHVIPICLAQTPVPSQNVSCYITGWGKNVSSDSEITSDVLLQANVTIQTNAECQRQKFPLPFNATKMICAHDPENQKDACQGDSGGPLVCLQNGVWYQYGIVSNGDGCAVRDHSGVYTRVSNYYNWLQEQIDDDSD